MLGFSVTPIGPIIVLAGYGAVSPALAGIVVAGFVLYLSLMWETRGYRPPSAPGGARGLDDRAALAAGA